MYKIITVFVFFLIINGIAAQNKNQIEVYGCFTWDKKNDSIFYSQNRKQSNIDFSIGFDKKIEKITPAKNNYSKDNNLLITHIDSSVIWLIITDEGIKKKPMPNACVAVEKLVFNDVKSSISVNIAYDKYYLLQNNLDLLALATIDGNIYTDFKYDYIAPLYHPTKKDPILFKFSEPNTKYIGLINQEGVEVLPSAYSKLEVCYGKNNKISDAFTHIIFEIDGKKGLMNNKFEVLIPPTYQYLSYSSLIGSEKEYFIFSHNDSIEKYGNKLAVGIIDEDNKIILPDDFSDISQYGRSEFKSDEYKTVSPLYYFFLASKDTAVNKKYAVFSGKTVQPITDYVFDNWIIRDTLRYDYYGSAPYIKPIENSFAFKFMDRLNYDYTSYSSYVILQKNAKQTLYDTNGNMLISADWDSIELTPNHNFFLCTKKNRQCIVSNKNKIIIPAKYDHIYTPIESHVFFVGKKQRKGDIRYALFDTTGKKKTDFVFIHDTIIHENYSVSDISNSLDEVVWDTIRRVDTSYINVGENYLFYNKLFVLKHSKNKLYGLYDFAGNNVLAHKYVGIHFLPSKKRERQIKPHLSYIAVKNEQNMCALFSPKVEQLTDFKYQYIYYLRGKMSFAAKTADNREIELDENGKEIK